MSPFPRTGLRSRLVVSAIVGGMAATFMAAVLPSGPASAHGNVTGPASRNYSCYERWSAKFQDPTMAAQDPMCAQAWQSDPNAMWNWNNLFREGVAGNHQAAIPDGQLCSAGHTLAGRYNSLDTVGDWKATNVANNFNVRLFDQALHGADYIRVYVSKPGYNPVTTPLKWSDLELNNQIGNTPASRWQTASGGVQIDVPVSAPGRSGRAMVYTIWQASHSDQSYYFCSDVNFGGTTTTPPVSTPPVSTPPVSTPPVSTPPVSTPPVSTPPATSGDCSATTSVSSWGGGFQTTVTVKAGSAALKGWKVSLAYPAAQTVQQGWSATVSASGSIVSATNVGYNGSLSAGASTSFGFISSGSPSTPTVTCSATV